MKILLFTLINNVLFGPGSLSLMGSSLNEHNCLVSAGYTFCKETNNCIRQWETPCSDYYNDCNDCLIKQRNGINIACPETCVPELPIPNIDPLPPVTVDSSVCSGIMCMMYCQYGNRFDENNCPLCECNDEIQILSNDCPLEQPSCDNYVYLCPKITEITNCNQGGIDGYTTFQLSVIIKDNTNVKNIFALYGTDEYPMYLPPAFQSSIDIGSNIGGNTELMTRYNQDVRYDSWLTIGITNGDKLNQLSSIGIDFTQWSETSGIQIIDGAVFVMDPQQVIVTGNEYIIGQITVRTGTEYNAIINIEGKPINTDLSREWKENRLVFPLLTPTELIHDNIPDGCISWNDGCNTCNVVNGILGSCTRLMCFTEETPRCLRYTDTGH